MSLPPPNPRSSSPSGSLSSAFTLIELLVVIAIIAILSIVVVLTLNPAQLLQQGRDANRVSDMSTLNTALGDYLAEGGLSLGSPNVVYVSIPDPNATSSLGDQCEGLNLISLPSGYSYACASSSTYKLVNGTGWIPVNFSSMAAGSPLSILPVDPINNSSSRLYYTYTTNGSQYEVTSVMESQKYQLGGSNDVVGPDGGTLASVYEKGSKLGLEPLDYGDPSLVGYWTFDEGTGTIAYDYSGNNATGSWQGTQIGTNGTYYSTNAKVGTYAGDFDGSSNYINVPNSNSLNFGIGAFSISAWVLPNSGLSNIYGIVGKKLSYNGSDVGWQMTLDMRGSANGTGLEFRVNDGSQADDVVSWTTPDTRPLFNGSSWVSVVCVINVGSKVTFYVNGVSYNTADFSIDPGSLNNSQFLDIALNNNHFPGLINDVRIYNRALSAAQIAAMYSGGK